MSLGQPGSPRTLYRRFEFESYAGTREFLNRLAALSEACDYYPNVDFGPTYAQVRVEAEDQARLAGAGSAFLSGLDRLAQSEPGSAGGTGG